MAKKTVAIVKLALKAGKATPAPPVGPALGQYGVNIALFCKEYNAKTSDKGDLVIPVEISIYEDKSFTFITKNPPVSYLIKKSISLAKGSSNPGKDVVGKITMEQIKEIAKKKMVDMNAASIESCASMIAGTAISMGLEVVE